MESTDGRLDFQPMSVLKFVAQMSYNFFCFSHESNIKENNTEERRHEYKRLYTTFSHIYSDGICPIYLC